MQKIERDNKDLVVMQWVFPRIPLWGREREVTKCLMRWIEKLCKTGVHFWIWCWTFLGLYRDWTFIPHDLDIDISATLDWNEWYEEWEHKVLDALSWRRLIRTIHYKWRIFQQAFIDENDVIFDVTYYYSWIKEGKLVSISDCWTVTETSRLFNYIIPVPCEEYLRERYWEWEIPTGEQHPRNFQCNSLNPEIESCET